MIRSFLCMIAAASLAACDPSGTVASAGSSPAHASASALPPPSAVSPLASTTIDDKGIIVAFEALDTTASAVDALIAARVVVPGTPRALLIANGLEGAQTWLDIASHAQQAGQADTYIGALAQASAAVAGVRSALKGN